jgi:hypothetical protein
MRLIGDHSPLLNSDADVTGRARRRRWSRLISSRYRRHQFFPMRISGRDLATGPAAAAVRQASAWFAPVDERGYTRDKLGMS